MKKILLSMLLVMTIIFAGCSIGPQDTQEQIQVEKDSTQENIPSIENSIEEDFSTEVKDIELGELI